MALGEVVIVSKGSATMVEKTTKEEIVLDDHDISMPVLENGALFIITKIDVVSQTRGECANTDFECQSNNDCPLFPGVSENKCADGFCQMRGWCPPLGGAETKQYIMDSSRSNITLWFRTSIQFPVLRPGEVYTNMDDESPTFDMDEGQTDAWLLSSLLTGCGQKMNDIVNTGAIINARLQWNCMLDTGEGCKFPEIQTKRLDSGTGYFYTYPHYAFNSALQVERDIRYTFRYTGVRLLVVSKGEAKGFSLMATTLQISSGLALLPLSITLTDLVMTILLRERRHYTAYKMDVTPDFSDIREKMTEYELQKRAKQGETGAADDKKDKP